MKTDITKVTNEIIIYYVKGYALFIGSLLILNIQKKIKVSVDHWVD